MGIFDPVRDIPGAKELVTRMEATTRHDERFSLWTKLTTFRSFGMKTAIDIEKIAAEAWPVIRGEGFMNYAGYMNSYIRGELSHAPKPLAADFVLKPYVDRQIDIDGATALAKKKHRSEADGYEYWITWQVPHRDGVGMTPVHMLEYGPCPDVNEVADSYIVYRLVKQLVLHEVDEQLQFDGVRLFDPHIIYDRLYNSEEKRIT